MWRVRSVLLLTGELSRWRTMTTVCTTTWRCGTESTPVLRCSASTADTGYRTTFAPALISSTWNSSRMDRCRRKVSPPHSSKARNCYQIDTFVTGSDGGTPWTVDTANDTLKDSDDRPIRVRYNNKICTEKVLTHALHVILDGHIRKKLEQSLCHAGITTLLFYVQNFQFCVIIY